MTRLAVVSHTPHHRTPEGLVGFGPTVTELSHLATLVDELVHVAPVDAGPAPASALPYTAGNVRMVPAPSAGGPGLRGRLALAAALPRWAAIVRRGLRGADLLHVRCPASISAVAIEELRLSRDRRPCWVKYAGNWDPDGDEPWSYRWQRRRLAHGFGRAVVTVNGTWDGGPHVRSFLNPSLTDDDLARGAAAATAKAPVGDAPALAFVGRVEAAKGAPEAVALVGELAGRFPGVTLDVVGDGPARPALEADAGDRVRFRGWTDRTGVHEVLARSHVLVLPTRASEGWPKVLSEGMAFGAVPVATALSSIPQVLAETGGGVAVPPSASFGAAVGDLLADPERLAGLRAAGLAAAPRFSFAAHLEAVRALFRDAWGVDL